MLVNSPDDFDFLKIGLASPDRILYWSHGEIEKPETINYRTFKPERKGLFCEKIFGPVKDWECACGKYRRIRYRGIVCERCGVEVTHSKVRRERMGHLALAAPVCHIWFLKGIPSYLGLFLDMTTRELEEVIYFDSYIVTNVDDSIADQISYKQLLSPDQYYDLKEEFGNKISADMGAQAIKLLLSQVDVKKLVVDLRESLHTATGQKRIKITKRLKVVDSILNSDNKPEWMIMDVVPIMPPDLRPMVQLEGGRFATSDLNDLYRRVVNRNNRLKRLIDIGAPEMIIRNEKRMLQEAVDVLISNGKRGRAVTGSNGRPLKSLGNIIEGKQGRFRQNLLGKRVDYSGRSVIVVGPNLRFHQCGLPKDMALELFKPFVIRRLVEDAYVTNVKSAKRKIEQKDVYVWDVLEDIIQGQAVLLNRAPTLHRLGIQAFEPILVEGSAIQVHPLVCTAFNADFDGDQMAVHVPLSMEAQAEARFLIMSTNNILAPSSGRPIVTPSQDMVLGIYFLTVTDPDVVHGKGKFFITIDEALRAWDAKAIELHSTIRIKEIGLDIETTVGRAIFNHAIWSVCAEFDMERSPYINDTVGKKGLENIIFEWFNTFNSDVISRLLDTLKSLGFRYATLSGISISISDLRVPKAKQGILEKADNEVVRLDSMQAQGSITEEEKHLRSHNVWRQVTSEISNKMEDEFGGLNNVFIMANSGARGNIDQVRQLAGMRGLMSDAQGRTVHVPIKANFKEGLSLAEYFISCYGARKGLVDTALRTADSGYLTRRLVDVAQDVTITAHDCGTKKGNLLSNITDGAKVVVPLSELIIGRETLEDVLDQNDNIIVKKGELITANHSLSISEAGIETVNVRSVYTCQMDKGICQKCYGVDLSSGKLINIGEAVGIIAAQSIGEPGTQLTMRTFHTGGVDLRKASNVVVNAQQDGVFSLGSNVQLSRLKADKDYWVTTLETVAFVTSKDNSVSKYILPKGSRLFVKVDDKVNKGDILFDYDQENDYILTQSSGNVTYLNLEAQEMDSEDGRSLFAQNTGEIFISTPKDSEIFELSDDIFESITQGTRLNVGFSLSKKVSLSKTALVTKMDKKSSSITVEYGHAYPINIGTSLYIKDGSKVACNDIIALERVSSLEGSKTKDIVQGLPRVEELFEARKNRNNAVITAKAGYVDISIKKLLRVISVMGEDGTVEYKVPQDVRLKVFSGQYVESGQILTEGVINPHDLLLAKGVLAAQKYLVEEVQKVYTSQGVKINNKHLEVIVRQMTRKVNISDMGDSEFLLNEVVDLKNLEKVNERLLKEGKIIAEATPMLLGITRSSLTTSSFISASSFQETAKVLSAAAIQSKEDYMYGLKENVIIGKLIPAGTGFKGYKELSIAAVSETPA